MRKLYFLFFLLICTLTVRGDEFENNYGRGIVHIQPDSFTTIDFYASPDSAFTYRLHMRSNSWSFSPIVNGSMFVGTTIPAWFTTLYFIPYGEYARIDIPAIDSVKGYYRTILTDSLGREVWVKKTEEVSFLSWFGFFNTLSSVTLLSEEIILRDKPSENSRQKNYSQIMYPVEVRTARVLQIKGLWMKIELEYPDQYPDRPSHIYTGWIKWRDEKELLIKYNLMGC